MNGVVKVKMLDLIDCICCMDLIRYSMTEGNVCFDCLTGLKG